MQLTWNSTSGKTKWLLFAGYNNCKINIDAFLQSIGPTLDHYMCKLEHFILLGDFNSEVQEKGMKEFCDSYNLKTFGKEATSFKYPLYPSSTQVILTN